MQPIVVGVVHADESIRRALSERIEGEEGLILAASVATSSDLSLPPGRTVIVVGGGALEDPALRHAKAARVVVTTGSLHEARAALALQARELVAWPEEARRLAGAIRSAGLLTREGAAAAGGPIITILGARGGLGTTTIAAWLAVALKAVALIELDSAGSLANFDLDSVPTLERLLSGAGPERTRSALRDGAIGVPAAFCDPASPEPTSDQIRSLMVSLRALDGPCVIDVGRAYGSRMVAVQQADLRYLVMADEVACVRSAKERQLTGMPWIRRKLLRRGAIPTKDLERAIGAPSVAVVEHDPRVPRDADLGSLSLPPNSIRGLAAHARGDVVESTQRPGPLARGLALVGVTR